MHWGRAKTLREAQRLKAQLVTDAARGELLPRSTLTVPEYGRRWIETYQGRTRKAIEEHTRDEYRARLEDAFKYFAGVRLTEVRPQDVKDFAAHVAKRPRRRKAKGGKADLRPLSAGSVRMALAPVKAMFATAFEEGLIRSNPTVGVRIVVPRAAGAPVDEDGHQVKAMSEEQLRQLLAAIAAADVRWLIFFQTLAALGLRVSEAIELRWRDVDLGTRTVLVRRSFRKGKVGPPKTSFSRRELKLNQELAKALWTLRKGAKESDLVFRAERGGRVQPSNLMSRVLKPAAVNAGVGEWVGFHTFRHTCATLLFNEAGWNPKQVQLWLGHHSAAFTLECYVHLLPADLPEPPALGSNARGNKGGNSGLRSDPQTVVDDSGGIADGDRAATVPRAQAG